MGRRNNGQAWEASWRFGSSAYKEITGANAPSSKVRIAQQLPNIKAVIHIRLCDKSSQLLQSRQPARCVGAPSRPCASGASMGRQKLRVTDVFLTSQPQEPHLYLTNIERFRIHVTYTLFAAVMVANSQLQACLSRGRLFVGRTIWF